MTLAEKLKSLGVKVGAQDISPPPKPHKQSLLEEILDGHPIETAQGETFVVDKYYPHDYRHGRASLLPPTDLSPLAAWAGTPLLTEIPPESIVFLDTETTGLTLGPGTYTFLIAVGRFEGDTFHLAQYFMRDPFQEQAHLAALEAFLAPCQAIVTFNGKAFDAPLINIRYQLHGLCSPLQNLAHVDMLHLARRLWKDRLRQRRLIDLELMILEIERSEEEIPSWQIPEFYFDYLRSGNPEPLRGVFYHNSMDVLSLAALFNHTANILANPLESAVQYGVDYVSMARLFEDLGEQETAIRLYLHGLDYEAGGEPQVAESDHPLGGLNSEYQLPQDILINAIQRLALIHKRANNFQAAVKLWERAAQYQDIDACIELAKYYEHYARDIPTAYQWTAEAIAIITSPGYPVSLCNLRSPELDHRMERLQRKLAMIGQSWTKNVHTPASIAQGNHGS